MVVCSLERVFLTIFKTTSATVHLKHVFPWIIAYIDERKPCCKVNSKISEM